MSSIMLSIISTEYYVNLVVNYVVNYLDQILYVNLVVNYVVNYLDHILYRQFSRQLSRHLVMSLQGLRTFRC